MNSKLSGEELIEAGLHDLRNGRETIAALLIAIGPPRLRQIGFKLPDHFPKNPEHRLYDLLSETDQDSAHWRYNALVRRLVSFERTAEFIKRGPSR